MNPLTCIFTCKYKHCQACETLVHSPPEENKDQPTTKGSSQLGLFFFFQYGTGSIPYKHPFQITAGICCNNQQLWLFHSAEKHQGFTINATFLDNMGQGRGNTDQKYPKCWVSFYWKTTNRSEPLTVAKMGAGREGEGGGDFNQPFHVLFILK